MKYKITTNSTEIDGTTLYQIQATRDVGDYVKKGDLGGYVEHDRNLSQAGYCWIHKTCSVSGNARIRDNAVLEYYSNVSGDVVVMNDCFLSCVRIHGVFTISGDTSLSNLTISNNGEYEALIEDVCIESIN